MGGENVEKIYIGTKINDTDILELRNKIYSQITMLYESFDLFSCGSIL